MLETLFTLAAVVAAGYGVWDTWRDHRRRQQINFPWDKEGDDEHSTGAQ